MTEPASTVNRYSQHLAYTLLATLLGLPLGCLVGGLLLSLSGPMHGAGDPARLAMAIGHLLKVTVAASFMGLLPAFLYGVPIYAWLSWTNNANILSAAVIGALPGIAMLSLEPLFSVVFMIFGVCVSLATHLLARGRLAALRSPESNSD